MSRSLINISLMILMMTFRKVVRRLLEHKVNKMEDVLSLEEMLAEGTTDTFKNRYNMLEKLQTSLETVRSHNGMVHDISTVHLFCVTWGFSKNPFTLRVHHTVERVGIHNYVCNTFAGILHRYLSELRMLPLLWAE